VPRSNSQPGRVGSYDRCASEARSAPPVPLGAARAYLRIWFHMGTELAMIATTPTSPVTATASWADPNPSVSYSNQPSSPNAVTTSASAPRY
jgi:hypothetical protein